MLIQFSVKNYKTFAEEAKLSMVANHDKTTRFAENVFQVPKYNLNLLKSAVVYGANASGKTKLVDAFAFMRGFVFNSAKYQSNEHINIQPFLLSTATEYEPSMFEVIFLYEGIQYRYGFEVTDEKVVAEWLYYKPKTKEIELFYRFEQDFGEVHKDFDVQDLIKRDRIKENSLLLSVADSANEPIAKKLFEWFSHYFVTAVRNNDEYYFVKDTIRFLQKPEVMAEAKALLDKADINIQDLQLLDNKLYSIHKKFDEHKRHVEDEWFDFQTDESAGTRKYLVIITYLIGAIARGGVLVLDELDAKLHPNLVEKIVQLFNSPTTNPKNAQLIFNTHNTNLLSADLFRRDQVWFVKKDHYGASTLYSLASFKTDEVRKDDNYEKKYIEGRYGGVPYLQDFEEAFNQTITHKTTPNL